MVQPLWKTVKQLFKKLNIESPDDPSISLLAGYLKELKTRAQTNTCVIIAALFMIAKGWKQLKCPSMDE